jgi:hypothetical protein
MLTDAHGFHRLKKAHGKNRKKEKAEKKENTGIFNPYPNLFCRILASLFADLLA